MSSNSRLKDLERVILNLISWANSSHCSDCIPFREAPSCIDWQHEVDCGHLETINEALLLLGRPLQQGHSITNPEAEMKKLADERLNDCINKGLIKKIK